MGKINIQYKQRFKKSNRSINVQITPDAKSKVEFEMKRSGDLIVSVKERTESATDSEKGEPSKDDPPRSGYDSFNNKLNTN